MKRSHGTGSLDAILDASFAQRIKTREGLVNLLAQIKLHTVLMDLTVASHVAKMGTVKRTAVGGPLQLRLVLVEKGLRLSWTVS